MPIRDFSFAFLGSAKTTLNNSTLIYIRSLMFGKKHNFQNQIGPSLVMFLLLIMFHLMILYFIRNSKNPNQQDLKTSNPLTEQRPATLHESSRLAKRFRDPETRLSMKFHPRIPTGFMYGIFTYIWLNFTVNIQYMEPMGFYSK